MHVTTCPFCGVVTDVPHNTQERCIEALHDEISRMRRLLSQVTPLNGLASEQDPQADPESDRD